MFRHKEWLELLREPLMSAKIAFLLAGLRDAFIYLSYRLLKTAELLSGHFFSSLARYPLGGLRANLYNSFSFRRLSGPRF